MITTIRVCPLCRLQHDATIKCRVYKKALKTIDSATVLQLQQALKQMGEKQPEVQSVLRDSTSGSVDPVHSSGD